MIKYASSVLKHVSSVVNHVSNNMLETC